ncbi:MAG: YdcF family protein [Terriglobia bacterium]
MVLRPFEDHFPPQRFPSGDAQAMVVISGLMEPLNPSTLEHYVGSDTYERCLYAAWLYKHWRPLPVVVSGGLARGKPHGVPDAAVMRQVLIEAGVPGSMIWCEKRSHSTHENALYSAQILRDKGIRKIVLVTSAFQMLRADWCFRKEGLIVTPAACDYRTFAPYRLSDYFPCYKGIRLNEEVLHETAGLLWYWVRGWV